MARLCLRVSFGLKRERRFDLEPSSTKRQMASGLEGLGIGCSLIHPSTEASSDRGSRRPIFGRTFALAAFVQRRSPALLLLLYRDSLRTREVLDGAAGMDSARAHDSGRLPF
jgi:hypothetical protein